MLTYSSLCYQIMVFGEITTRSPLDYQKIIRDTVKKIGYDHSDKGFDYKSQLQCHFLHTRPSVLIVRSSSSLQCSRRYRAAIT